MDDRIPLLKSLLADAQREILELRRKNELLQAKISVMDLFACVLHTTPAAPSQAMTVDVAWQLQRMIDELSEGKTPITTPPPVQDRSTS